MSLDPAQLPVRRPTHLPQVRNDDSFAALLAEAEAKASAGSPDSDGAPPPVVAADSTEADPADHRFPWETDEADFGVINGFDDEPTPAAKSAPAADLATAAAPSSSDLSAVEGAHELAAALAQLDNSDARHDPSSSDTSSSASPEPADGFPTEIVETPWDEYAPETASETETEAADTAAGANPSAVSTEARLVVTADPDDMPAWHPTVTASALHAEIEATTPGAGPFVRLLPTDLKPEQALMRQGLSAFSRLPAGFKGGVYFSARAVPDFPARFDAWKAGFDVGEAPSKRRGWAVAGIALLKALFVALFLPRLVLWWLFGDGKTRPTAIPERVAMLGAAPDPAAPKRKLTPSETLLLAAAAEKAKRGPWFEVDMWVVVAEHVRSGELHAHKQQLAAEHDAVAAPSDAELSRAQRRARNAEAKAERARLRAAIADVDGQLADIAAQAASHAQRCAAEFDNLRSSEAHLVWKKADPVDALAGNMGVKERDVPSLMLCADELAHLTPVPDKHLNVSGVKVRRSRFKNLPLDDPIVIEDPYNPPKGIVPLGIMNPGGADQRYFGMRNADLDKHMFYVGGTGTGKSEFMKWLVFGCAKADYPIVVLDPHGALSDDLLTMLVKNVPERRDDVVFCDLSDDDYPVGLNPLDISQRNAIEPTVGSLMEMLEMQMNLGQSAPRAVNLARQALSALCEANLHLTDPDTKVTLLDVTQFLLNEEFRQQVMSFCSNLAARESFHPETGSYELLLDKQRIEYAMPIVRAFQPLAASDTFSAVFSSSRNLLDFGRLMSGRKIVLVKLARFNHQKALGEFVGALIPPWLLSSMDDWGRKRDPETGEYVGVGCRVFVDEAGALLGPNSAFVQILPEARKWDFGAIPTSQYSGQLPAKVQQEVIANTKSKISFQQEATANKAMMGSICGNSQELSAEDVAAMPNYHFSGSVLLPGDDGGVAKSPPFTAKALPPMDCEPTPEVKAAKAAVIEQSRALICNRRDEIEDRKLDRFDDVVSALATTKSPVKPGGPSYAIAP